MLEKIHLKIIYEVDRQGTLTAAAEKLCLTQSALSHTIKKLETALGIPIWIREGRHLRLTQAGEFLLSTANRLLPQIEHTEERLHQYAKGKRGTLRIGMECHPCYRWLLKIVAPYLSLWPMIDVDVKQRFQFGGIGALFGYEIDVLITPDPLFKAGLNFEPVFSYEQVLVVSRQHPLAKEPYIEPSDLKQEILISYPVEQDRLDIYTQFLQPAGIMPKQHKTIETTDIMLQMVASQRGVAALPRWLVDEYKEKMSIVPIKLGTKGIHKHIFLGTRQTDIQTPYLSGFIELAHQHQVNFTQHS